MPKYFGNSLNDFNITTFSFQNDDEPILLLGRASNPLHLISEHLFKSEQKTSDESDNVCIHEGFYRLDSFVELTLYDLLRGRVNCYVGHGRSPS